MNWIAIRETTSRARPTTVGARRTALAVLGLACALLACTGAPKSDPSGAPEPKPAMPALEEWGDLDLPYGDAIEIAARRALGRRDPRWSVRYDGVTLEDYLALDLRVRDDREEWGRVLRRRADELRRLSGTDSLGLYLEAIHTAPIDVLSYEQAVRILLQRGATQRAHALVVQAVRLDPENPQLWVYLAEAYRQLGDYDRAISAYEYVQDLGGRWRASPHLSGQGSVAYRDDVHHVAEALAVLYIEKGEPARAESLLANSDTTAAWLQQFARAQQARQRGDLQAAAQALREAARLPRAQAAVFAELGSVEHALGNLDAAECAYREALRLAPHERAARNGLGVVLWAQGDLEGAVLRFDRLVRSNPEDHAARFNLGGATLQLAASRSGRGADSLNAVAESAFTHCIDVGYQTQSAHVGRAQARLRRGDVDGAMADAKAALQSGEHEASARLLVARASLSRGNPQETVVLLQPVFDDDRLDEEGLFMLGKAYLDLERARDAVPVLRRAYELEPDDWRVAMNYGVALSEAGQRAEAESVLRGVAEKHPDNPDVLQNLAAVLVHTGRKGEANRLLQRARELREP